MRTPIQHLALLLVTPVLMTACGGVGPAEALEAQMDALAEGRLSTFLESAMSEEDYRRAEASWNQQRAKPPTIEEAARFSGIMALLTAKGGEKQVVELLRPQLGLIESRAAEFLEALPFLLGGLAGDQSGPGLEATAELQRRFSTLGLADEKKLEKAVKALSASARDLDIPTMAALAELDFEEAMEKADIAATGIFEVLDVYGLGIEKTLDSMEFDVVSEDGDSAEVEVTYELFGAGPQKTRMPMRRVDGRWILLRN